MKENKIVSKEVARALKSIDAIDKNDTLTLEKFRKSNQNFLKRAYTTAIIKQDEIASSFYNGHSKK